MGKGAPRRCDLLGAPLAMMCLPPASEPVKPLADVVNGYTCSDSQDKILDEIRHGHSPPSHYRDGVRTEGIVYQISTPSASAAFAASKRSPAEKEPLPKRQGLLLPFPRRGHPPDFPATFIWGIAAPRVLCYTISKPRNTSYCPERSTLNETNTRPPRGAGGPAEPPRREGLSLTGRRRGQDRSEERRVGKEC